MEAASNAISSILYVYETMLFPSYDHELTSPSKGSGQENTAVDETVAPAVEHETKTNKHETREQDVIEKERHQDHYHTTIQPLQDREELPEEHKHEQGATQYREVDHDDGGAKDEVDAQRAEFRNTSEQAATQESKTKEATVSGEHVHHHLHETIQPVIYKGRLINVHSSNVKMLMLFYRHRQKHCHPQDQPHQGEAQRGCCQRGHDDKSDYVC